MTHILLAVPPLFGTKHWILVAGSVLMIVGVFLLLKNIPFKTLCKIMLGVGIVSEFVKIFYYIVANEATHGGVLPKSDLPFHLCSIQILFFVFLNVSKNEKAKKVLLGFMRPSCLFGGIAAILIPTASARSTWIITCQYFLYHIALIVFALYLYFTKEMKFDIKDYKNCLIFIFVLMFVSIYLNSILSDGVNTTNFMYVVAPPQERLPYLNKNNGWLSYIFRYAVLIVFCITISYIKPIILAIKEKCKRKPQQTEKAQTDETLAD